MAESLAINITCEGSTQQGTASLIICPREEAMLKGGIAWASLWIIMIPTIFIPIVHFFAVPILLVSAPIVGRTIFNMYNGKESLTVAPIPCPKCKESIGLSSNKSEYPINSVCLGCKTSYSAEIT
jgi:hypothetical protein